MLSTIQRCSAISLGDSWQPWRIGIASRGEKLTKSERKILEPLTGRTTFPDQPVRRFTCCVGRRGGKTRSQAVYAAYLAAMVDWRDVIVKCREDGGDGRVSFGRSA